MQEEISQMADSDAGTEIKTKTAEKRTGVSGRSGIGLAEEAAALDLAEEMNPEKQGRSMAAEQEEGGQKIGTTAGPGIRTTGGRHTAWTAARIRNPAGIRNGTEPRRIRKN